MTIEVKLPDLGDGIRSGDVLEIFVSVGDTIKKGEDIVEMETDKATVMVPASIGGTVTKVVVKVGDTVAIDGAILELEEMIDTAMDICPKCGTRVIRSEQKCDSCGEERTFYPPWPKFMGEDQRKKIIDARVNEDPFGLSPVEDAFMDYVLVPVLIIFLIVASLFFWWLFFAIAPIAILCWAVMTGKIKLTHEVDVDEFLDQE